MEPISGSTPANAYDAYDRLMARYQFLMSSGDYRPMVHPWGTFGVVVVIVYLLFDHRQSWFLRQLRFPVWLFNFCFSIYTVIYCRGRTPSAALGVGMLSAWSILWTANFLVFDDCQVDYLRIEKRSNTVLVSESTAAGDFANGIANGKSTAQDADQDEAHLRRSHSQVGDKPAIPLQKHYSVYYWQSYPATGFRQRLDWVLDIFSTFRGMGWNWRINGLPFIPAAVEQDLDSSIANVQLRRPAKPSVLKSYSTRSAILSHNLYILIKDYLILDLIKTLMAHDAYFWGYIHTTRPPTYLPPALRSSPFAIRASRLLISLGTLKYGLEIIFCLGPLFFIGLLGPRRVSVRGEPWLYPDQFGPLSAVLDNGLAGWWGRFWHQTFRKGFEAPGAWLVRVLALDPRSTRARIVQLFTAFGLSGFVHACGSYTLLMPTEPWRPLVFFLAQAGGIVLQMALVGGLKRVGVAQRVPRWVRRWSNFFFAHVWLYYTAGLLVDDFCQGGLWLVELIPISILRGPLRLGGPGDTWFRWGGTLVWWYKGEHWWQSGFAG